MLAPQDKPRPHYGCYDRFLSSGGGQGAPQALDSAEMVRLRGPLFDTILRMSADVSTGRSSAFGLAVPAGP